MNIAQQINDLLTAADCYQIPSVYAGVGARKTPVEILDLMTRLARKLDEWGWTVRGGAVEGADEAFDCKVTRAEIFLPWPRFAEMGWRNHPLPDGPNIRVFERPTLAARDIAAKHHPAWQRLDHAKQKLMARNTHEILGRRCDAPVSFVLAWTPDGSTGQTTARTGGTGQAIRIAAAHEIPIFNLALQEHREAWEEAIR